MGCPSCNEPCLDDTKIVRCGDCWLWYHLKCANLQKLPPTTEKFTCVKCLRSIEDREKYFHTLTTLLEQQSALTQKQSKAIAELLKHKETDAVFMRRQTLQKLPVFSGKFSEWPKFKAIYDQTTAEGKFSDVENTSRLLEALKGPAKDLVEVKLANPGNLSNVSKELEANFGDSNCIHKQLVTELLSAKAPKDEKRQTFVEFGIKLSNLVCNMKLLNLEDRYKDPRLIDDLMENFSPSQQEKWINYKTDKDKTDLRLFNEFVQDRLTVLRQLKLPEDFKVTHSSQPRGNVHLQATADDDINQQTVESREDSAKSTKCVLCDSTTHKISKCEDFLAMPINARWSKAKELKLCFGCLGKSNHRLNQCRYAKPCQIDNCRMKHHKLMHYVPDAKAMPFNRNQNDNEQVTSTVESPNTPAVAGAHWNVYSNPQSMFLIVPATIEYGDNVIDTYVMLDYGSAFTLIDKDFAERLQVAGTVETFSMLLAKQGVVSEPNSIRTSFKISAREGKKKWNINNVRTVKDLGLPVGSLDPQSLINQHSYLSGLPLPSFNNVRPMLLIGVNNPSLLTYSRVVEHGECEPVAVKTKFSWAVFGEATKKGKLSGAVLHIQDPSQQDLHDNELHDLVKNFFTTESFGIKPLINEEKSDEDRRVEEIVNNTMKKIDDRYQIGLLWKNDSTSFPDSYPMAYKRLLLVENRMKRDPDLAKWYDEVFQDYLQKGYCRKLSPDEVERASPRNWYIPFFHVINANKTPRKIRLVFYAAAKINKISLNTELLTGSNHIISLPGIIFKSREGRYCVAADIQEMFPQVKIIPEDQNSQRFLWREGDQSRAPDVYIMTSMIFGAACSPFLAQVVKNRHALKYQETFPEAVNAIINHHFVDDYIDSYDDEVKAATIAQEVVNIHREAGFNLRNFVSNSSLVLKSLPQSASIVK